MATGVADGFVKGADTHQVQSPSRQWRSAKTENMMVSFISVSRSLKRDALAAARERQLIED